MSTRSVIAVKNEDGAVSGIYCHFDGYPEGVGNTLVKHYRDASKINQLIELGSLSSLGERVAPNPGENHSFANPIDDVTVAYHRDRGDKLRFAQVWEDENKMLEDAFDSCWAAFCYLWKDGAWYFDQTHSPEGWRLVSDALNHEDEEA